MSGFWQPLLEFWMDIPVDPYQDVLNEEIKEYKHS